MAHVCFRTNPPPQTPCLAKAAGGLPPLRDCKLARFVGETRGLGLSWGYIGIMEKKMETTIIAYIGTTIRTITLKPYC